MLGKIIYIYALDLESSLAVRQKLDKGRFAKVIEEKPVAGGKNGEQYIEFKAQSLFNEKSIYTLNNYLSPYNYCTISELEQIIKNLDHILLPDRKDDINYIVKGIKEKIG